MAYFKKNSNAYQSKKNIIVGRHPVVEALTNQVNIDKILMYKNASGDSIHEIRNLAKELNVPIQYVPNEKLHALTNIQHQGVVAYRSAVSYQDLQQVINWVVDKGEVPLFLMLDGVTDTRNIGAIARSAVCCGAQAIIIPDKGVAALNEEAVKSSAGALAQIHICRVSSLAKAVDELHLNGIKVCTSEMNAEKPIFHLNLTEPCCMVMGDEGKGIQHFITKVADERFSIPMKNNFDSFNVSVACGIILYEAMKQRLD